MCITYHSPPHSLVMKSEVELESERMQSLATRTHDDNVDDVASLSSEDFETSARSVLFCSNSVMCCVFFSKTWSPLFVE